MNASLPTLARRGWLYGLSLFFAFHATLSAATDDERIQRLRDDIRTLETVVEGTANATEKTRLQTKAERLKEELAVLQERQDIEKRQRALIDSQPSDAVDRLRERLRAIDIGTEALEKRMQDISTQRRAIAAERDGIDSRLVAAKAADTSKAGEVADLEEQLINRNEALRSLALQREAAEARMELAREADRLRGFVKDIDVNNRPNLRAIFEAYTKAREGQKSEDKLTLLIGTVENNLRVASSNYELAQQKMAKFDEELALLEKQTGFFRTDPAVAKLLVAQKIQKRLLGERLPVLGAQVDALRATVSALQARQELTRLEGETVRGHYQEMRAGYLMRLRWPIVAMTGLGALYLILHYIGLRLFYRKESLLLARRLARYTMLVAAAGVFAGFLFDDLSMVAATLGVVSAALVISLQDVCTSIAGWFVIMTGSKFRIGDRLEIDGTRGDVIDIQLLRTTLIEVGQWMDNDHPTGRVVVVPNNFIFKGKVYNFSHHHSFVWDFIPLTIAFCTPMAEALTVLNKVLAEETLEEFNAAQQEASKFRARYGVDDAIYSPRVSTSIVDSGVLVKLSFVSHYRRTGSVKNRIHRRLIMELEKHPQIQLANTTYNIVHTPMGVAGPAAIMGSEANMESRPPFGFPNNTNGNLRTPLFPGR